VKFTVEIPFDGEVFEVEQRRADEAPGQAKRAAEKKAQRRAELIAAGLCSTCGSKKHGRFVDCASCRIRQRERKRKRRVTQRTGTSLIGNEHLPDSDVVCECDRPKEKGAICCEECSRLDAINLSYKGQLSVESGVVSALRALGGTATLPALTEELGLSQRNVLLGIQRLKESGRVKRVIPLGGEAMPADGWKDRYGTFEARFGDVPNGRGGTIRMPYFVFKRKEVPIGRESGIEGARPVFMLVEPKK
jgi:hypothetical protein